jgi:hypothetical protein
MIMAKKAWDYFGSNTAGSPMEGTVFASSPEEAGEIVKKMGILNPKIIDQNAPKVPKHELQLPKVMPPVPAPFSRPAHPMPSVEHLQPPMNKSLENLAQQAMALGEAAERQNAANHPRRRQRIIISNDIEIYHCLEPYLANQNGKIINVVMTPNHLGKMMVAVAIEHDTIEHENGE